MYGFLCNRRTTKHSSGFYFEYRTWSRRRYSDEHSSSTINRRWNNSKYVYVTCHCKYSSKLDIFTISCQSNKECIYNDALDDITQAWDNCSAEKLLQYACVVLYTYIHLIKLRERRKLKQYVCLRDFRATAWCYFPAIAGPRQHFSLPSESQPDDRWLRDSWERHIATGVSAMIYGEIVSRRVFPQSKTITKRS